jgi:hypothetical protein
MMQIGFNGYAKEHSYRNMLVGGIENQGDRILLFADSLPDYHIIAGVDCPAQVGDVIQYEPYGYNFGWYKGIFAPKPKTPNPAKRDTTQAPIITYTPANFPTVTTDALLLDGDGDLLMIHNGMQHKIISVYQVTDIQDSRSYEVEELRAQELDEYENPFRQFNQRRNRQ